MSLNQFFEAFLSPGKLHLASLPRGLADHSPTIFTRTRLRRLPSNSP
jgi:hypothetical protein